MLPTHIIYFDWNQTHFELIPVIYEAAGEYFMNATYLETYNTSLWFKGLLLLL